MTSSKIHEQQKFKQIPNVVYIPEIQKERNYIKYVFTPTKIYLISSIKASRCHLRVKSS